MIDVLRVEAGFRSDLATPRVPAWLWLFIVAAGGGPTEAADPHSSRPTYSPPEQIATLENEAIVESSGIAPSHRSPGVFWTHNDSGDKPRLFAFDERGRSVAECQVTGANAVDWEDISSFVRDGKSWLLVADVGDNARRRETSELYLLPEPDLGQSFVKVAAIHRFRFAGGPRDCEAVGIDATNRTVLLTSKGGLRSEVFSLTLPDRSTDQVLVAESIGSLAVPFPTAMDVSSDGTQAVVLTYGHAYEFHRGGHETWKDALVRAPRELAMPARRQGESICYGAHDQTLYLTSEKQPTPLWRIKVSE